MVHLWQDNIGVHMYMYIQLPNYNIIPQNVTAISFVHSDIALHQDLVTQVQQHLKTQLERGTGQTEDHDLLEEHGETDAVAQTQQVERGCRSGREECVLLTTLLLFKV